MTSRMTRQWRFDLVAPRIYFEQTPPVGANAGDIFIDSDDRSLRVHDGIDFKVPALTGSSLVDAVLTGTITLTPTTDTILSNGTGLVVGHTAQLTVSDGDGATNLIPEVQVSGTAKADGSVLISVHNVTNDATVAPMLGFLKSAAAAIGTATTVIASGEVLGEIVWFGSDGADYESPAAAIRAEADAATGAGDMPGRLVFLTTTDAGETLTERLRIASDGLVTVSAGLTATTGNVTISAGSVSLGEATVPAGTVCYIGRDNTGDTTINALTSKTINLAINGVDIVTLSATVLTFTGTIAATGARVTQSYHTNITSTNAVTVDSSETVKLDIGAYDGDALALVNQMDVITYRHEHWLDPSDALKLGIRAESVREPLAVSLIERDTGAYPGLNLYGLATLNTRAIQQLAAKIAALESKIHG